MLAEKEKERILYQRQQQDLRAAAGCYENRL